MRTYITILNHNQLFKEVITMHNKQLRGILTAALAGLIVSLLSGLIAPTPAFSAPSDSMLAGSTRLSDGTTMFFRLYVPRNYSKAKKHPLVVTLHGVGEKGSDNRIQVDREDIVRQWMLDSVQRKYAPFILSPQCPSALSWAAADGSAGVADNGIVKVIDSLKTVYSLDTTRLYVAGLSMGGAGTWGMVKSYPRKFAAVVPCAGAMGWNPNFTVQLIDGANTAKTPYWAFHGISDPTVDVLYSRRIDTAVRSAGFPVVHYTSAAMMTNPTGISTDSLRKAVVGGALYLYSEIINGDHRAGWMDAWYSPLLVPWLFSKSKENGKTTFTWPAPGTLETGVSMERQRPLPSTGKISVAERIVRWQGISRLPARIKIYSVIGTMVMRHDITIRNGTLACAGLAKGIYCVEVNGPGWSESGVLSIVDHQ